jgi:hypothetical protein
LEQLLGVVLPRARYRAGRVDAVERDDRCR